VRRSAAQALVLLSDEAMLKEFVKSLKDASSKVVAGAAQALGDAGYKPAVPYLLKALRTDHPRVAAAIASALGKLGDVQAVPWLVTELKTGLAPVECAEALGRLGDAQAAKPLLEALGHQVAPVRAAAAKALGDLANAVDFVVKDQALKGLQKLLQDADERARLTAAVALGQYGDKAGAALLKKFVEG
jgi:HEAT repeat protein